MITKESIIGDVLDKFPATAPLFLQMGMHCLGCPASRGESIEEACMVHGADPDALVAALNKSARRQPPCGYRDRSRLSADRAVQERQDSLGARLRHQSSAPAIR